MPHYESDLAQCLQDAQLLRERIELAKAECRTDRTIASRRLAILEGMLETVELEARRYRRLMERSNHD